MPHRPLMEIAFVMIIILINTQIYNRDTNTTVLLRGGRTVQQNIITRL